MSTTPLHSPDPKVLTLADIPGKGKGLLARVSITPGTLIIGESPLFTTASLTDASTFERDLAAIVRALPKEGQRAFLSLHNNHPGSNPFSNIVRSNGSPLGANSDVGGIFPIISRFNHSCRPNAQHAWNDARKQLLVHAIRSIPEGEEITLSYSFGGPSSSRKRDLKAYFGFECACDVCSLPPTQLAESDARFRQAAGLDQAIGDARRVRESPDRALADCRSLRNIYGAERITDSRVARLYWDAFQICAMHSDAAHASVFARRYHEAKTLCEGADHAEAGLLQQLIRRPAEYENFGVTKRWQTDAADVPGNLSEQAFEAWLWREDS